MGRQAGGASVSQWPMAEFGPYLPDVPALVNPGMKFAKNILPKANGFYGPCRALETFSNNTVFSLGLPHRINGTIHSFKNPANGDVFYYAGSSALVAGNAQLFRFTETTRTWSDVSTAGGYTVTVGQAWRFANMGSQVIACAGFGTNMQTLADGAVGNFSALSATAPQAVDIAVVNPGFLVALSVRDQAYGAGFQYYRLWWSGIRDAGNWPDPLSDAARVVQSDFQDLFGGGRLHRIVPGIGGNDAVIIGERHIWRMNYVGAPNIFDFRVAEFDQGTTCPGSVIALNETLFYYGHGGFYAFDGSNSTPIGRGHIDETFANEVVFSSDNGTQRAMCGGVDTDSQTVYWSYRTASAPTPFNNKLLAYNLVTQRWGTADIGIDAMGRVDTEIARTDSPILVVMGQDFHAQRMIGLPLEAILETREHGTPGGGETMVKSARPLVDASDIYVTLRTRDRLSQELLESSESGLEVDGTAAFDGDDAGYYRARCRIPAGIQWTDAIGVEFETAPASHGLRRRG